MCLIGSAIIFCEICFPGFSLKLSPPAVGLKDSPEKDVIVGLCASIAFLELSGKVSIDFPFSLCVVKEVPLGAAYGATCAAVPPNKPFFAVQSEGASPGLKIPDDCLSGLVW